MFFKYDAYSVDKGFGAGGKIFDTAGSVVDHGHNHGIAFVQPAENVVGAFCIRHNGSVFVKWPPVIQKTDFQHIHAGTDQAFKNIDDIAIAKLPVIDKSTVAQCTVK